MIDERNIRVNSFHAWVLASRPKTLSGAMVPVVLGIALAAKDTVSGILWLPAVLCMMFALIMQIDANFVNDYFDWKRGNDDVSTRLGPLRACSMGWVTPKAMLFAIFITTAVACMVGLPLIFYGGMKLIIVGILCVLFCILYTTTLSYIGLGDLLVFVFFGIVPVCFTYYVQTGYISLSVFVVSLACGCVIDNLLILNNYRDIDNDRRDGKRTLIVLIGRKGGRILYLLLGITAVLIMSYYDNFSVLSLIMTVYLMPHILTYMKMCRLEGRALNKVLGMTARNIIIFGFVSSFLIIA
jgi:1,4-dihydroxy-2-naphthoate octaprenyltransferase